jgi:hypothetical protein
MNTFQQDAIIPPVESVDLRGKENPRPGGPLERDNLSTPRGFKSATDNRRTVAPSVAMIAPWSVIGVASRGAMREVPAGPRRGSRNDPPLRGGA